MKSTDTDIPVEEKWVTASSAAFDIDANALSFAAAYLFQMVVSCGNKRWQHSDAWPPNAIYRKDELLIHIVNRYWNTQNNVTKILHPNHQFYVSCEAGVIEEIPEILGNNNWHYLTALIRE